MQNKFIRQIFIGLVLIGICMFAILPLFHGGYFTMHDDEQIGRLQQMYLVLSQGQIPPRWIPDLGFGYGYPLFNFYPPLVYYLGSFFHMIGFSFINSTKIVMGLGFVLSACVMYGWVRKHYGVLAGLFAALLYTYAPYHSVDLYVRGALSEFFSWVFVPLVFWMTDLVFEKKEKKYIVLLGLSLGLLVLSHTLVMLQLAPLYVLYIGLLVLFKKEGKLLALVQIAIAGAIGLGLTSYFWIPSILEKQYTLVDAILTKQLASYALYFVCPQQLWSSLWGYGGSVAGCVDGLSFQIGKIQAVIGAFGIVLSTFFVIKKKYPYSLIGTVLFLCSIFLTLNYSKFLWDMAKPFWYIQFPWRYLLFVAVGSAFLGGFVVFLVEKRFGKTIGILFIVIFSALAVFQVRNYFQPQSYRMVTDKDMTSKEELQWRVSSMSYEYVPNLVATRLSMQKTTELAINKKDLPTQSYTVLSGKANVVVENDNLTFKQYEVRTTISTLFQVNTYNFPGWTVLLDGKRAQIVKNKLDLLQIMLPSGKHQVVVKFVDTPVRTVANDISLATLFILVGYFALAKLKNK